MKILIVEDEPSLREIMVQTLRREQYVVEQAADYASALDKIAGYDYDCILLDIMLPDGSGLQLLEELKRQRRQAGIIGMADDVDQRVLHDAQIGICIVGYSAVIVDTGGVEAGNRVIYFLQVMIL